MAITHNNNNPKEPKLCDFSYICSYDKPPHTLLEAQNNFNSIFVVGGTNFRIINFFLAFFEAKRTKIVILDQKIIDPDDYHHFWVHFVNAKSRLKWYFLVSNPIFKKFFYGILVPHPFLCKKKLGQIDPYSS